MGLILISLLGAGAIAALLFDLFRDDGDDSTPATPGTDDGSGTDTPGTPDTPDAFTGTIGNDLLRGTEGDDALSGLAGDDSLISSDGDDAAAGGEGNDSLDGGAGSDSLFGQQGNDQLFGRTGDDLLLGGDGDDLIKGAEGDDLLSGDLGADTLMGGVGADLLIGGNLGFGNIGAIAEGETLDLTNIPETDDDAGDQMSGGWGDDTFIIGSADTVTGDGSDDSFILGDWITEDAPALITDYTANEDVITVSHAPDLVDPMVEVTADAEGNALVSLNGQLLATVTGAGETLTAEDVILVARTAGPEPEPENPGDVITGTEGADSLSGTPADDTVLGLDGNDVLWGRGGDDALFAGDGDDVMTGALGNDRAFGAAGNDVISGLWGNDFLRGGSGDDYLIDTVGADTLSGDGGNDTIMSVGLMDEEGLMVALADLDTTETSVAEALGPLLTANQAEFGPDPDRIGDELNGGNGDDVIYMGRLDVATGGNGADGFIAGDWIINRGDHVTVTDFTAGEDTLVYSVNAETTPSLTVTYSEGATEDSGDAMVLDGGRLVIMVQGVGTGFTVDDVSVMARG